MNIYRIKWLKEKNNKNKELKQKNIITDIQKFIKRLIYVVVFNM